MAKHALTVGHSRRHTVEQSGPRVCQPGLVVGSGQGCARYIGRVGALAVALGVGAAVATGFGMGVARADDSGATDSASVDTPSAPPAEPTGAPASQPPAPAEIGGGDADPGDGIDSNEGPMAADMQVHSSGGQDTSVNDEGQSTDQLPEDGETAESDPNDPGEHSVDVEAGSGRVTTEPTPPRGRDSTPPVDTAVDSLALSPSTPTAEPDSTSSARTTDPAGVFDTSRLSTMSTAVTAPAAFVGTAADPAAEPAPSTTIATEPLGKVLSPLLTPLPEVPVESPLALGLLAWVRQEGQRRYAIEHESLVFTTALVNSAPAAGNDSVSTKEDTAVTVNVLANDKDADGQSLTPSVVTGPVNGSVSVNADGSMTYTPNLNFNGTDTFTYAVSDGTVSSAPATVTVKVTAVNDVPIANPDTATTIEDTPVVIDVKANDTDVENNTLTPQVLTQPANGKVVRNADGTYTYTPKANFNGTDTFTYRLFDGKTSAPTTVTVTVSPVNDVPAAGNDSVSTKEDTAVTVNVLANDKDADGQSLTPSVVTGPVNGSVSVNADGSMTYTPNLNFNGTDTFTYAVSDGTVSSAPATVTVKVTAVNDVPIANPDTATTTEDTPVVIDVKANDTDVENNTLTPQVLTQPANGKVVRNADGTYTYTPKANFNGTDTFTYRLFDGKTSAPTTVTVTVSPVNDVPAAGNDSVSTKEDTAVTVNVLANDKDADGQSLTPSVVTGPVNGSVSVNADGSMTYTPNLNFNGTDTFTYAVSDGTVSSAPATVTVKVTAVNDVPIANPDTATTATNTPVVIAVKANDVDPDDTNVIPSVLSQPVNGTVVRNANGTFTYTPRTNFAGTDAFTYRLFDGASNSAPATVTVTVGQSNQAPVANNDTSTVAEGGTQAINVLANDTDPNGTATINLASVIVTQQPANGSATVNANGTITYVSNGNEATSDSFSYTVKDVAGAVSNTATVTVTITPVNDAPSAVNDAFSVASDDSLTVIGPGVLVNDSDAEASSLTARLIAGPAHSTSFSLNADGSFNYTPEDGYSGTDTFTYVANDGVTDSAIATVSITVTQVDPTNTSPTARPLVTDINLSSGVVTGTLGAADADGDPVLVTVVKQPLMGGSVSIDINDGTFTYSPSFEARVQAYTTPVADTDTFIVEVWDGQNPPVAVTVNVPVVPVEGSSYVASSFPTNLPADAFVNRVEISPDGSRVLVSGAGAWGVYNANGGAPIGVHVLPDSLRGDTSLTPDGTRAYSLLDGGGLGPRLQVNDAITGAFITSLPVDSTSRRVDVHGDLAYIVRTDGSAVVVDTTTNTVVGPVLPPGGYPPRPDLDDGVGQDLTYRLNVTGSSSGRVDIYANGLSEVGPAEQVYLNFQPGEIALSPDGTRAYISEANGSRVHVVVLGTRDLGSPTNPAPKPSPPSPVKINDMVSSTGAVSGSVKAPPPASNPNGTMHYEGSSTGPLGQLVVNDDGTFTFTPTAEARDYVAQSGRVHSMLVFVKATDDQGNSIAIPVTVPILPTGHQPSTGTLARVSTFYNLPGALQPEDISLSDVLTTTTVGAAQTAEGEWDYAVQNWKYTGAAPLVTDPDTGLPVLADVYVVSLGVMPGDLQNGYGGNAFVLGYRKLEPGQDITVKVDYPREEGGYTSYGLLMFTPGTFPDDWFTTRIPGVVGGSIFNNEIPGVDFQNMQERAAWEDIQDEIDALNANRERTEGALVWGAQTASAFGQMLYGGGRPRNVEVIMVSVRTLPEGFELVENPDEWPAGTDGQYLLVGQELENDPPQIGIP